MGTSRESSTIKSLFKSIINQLDKIYGTEEYELTKANELEETNGRLKKKFLNI